MRIVISLLHEKGSDGQNLNNKKDAHIVIDISRVHEEVVDI
jgi:hypothetical protein